LDEVSRRRHAEGEKGFLVDTAGVTLYRTRDDRLLYCRPYFAGDGSKKDEITVLDPAMGTCLQWDGLAPHFADRRFGGHEDTWRDLGEEGYEQYVPIIDAALESIPDRPTAEAEITEMPRVQN
jgi:hypothetical protein